MAHFIVHPRIETSFLFHPGREILWHRGDIEARLPEHPWAATGTVLEFLLQYDYRGSNKFQEQENLEFLRLYIDKYPQIRQYFREDILIPTVWEPDTDI